MTLLAQPESAAPVDPNVIHVDVDVVNVLATVRDRHGRFVNGLSKEDFEIREDGKPQEIRYFTREVETPFTVALLLDVSGSVHRILETEKTAAARFLGEVMRPGDRALLASFAQTVAVWQDLTGNLDRLSAALIAAQPFDTANRPEFAPHGGTLLFEGVSLVSEKKLSKLAGRKAIVVISDGMDNGSKFPLDAAVKAAQQADAVVYAIQYFDAGTLTADESSAAGIAMRKLAEPTGGQVFRVNWGASLADAFQTIREEMRSQYAIGFTSSNPARGGSYRRLEVKTATSGLRVHARQGYYQ